MNPVANLFITKIPNANILNNADFLKVSNAITYTTSASGQALGVFNNKKISKDERFFIAKQEVIKGALDLAIFLALTQKFKNFGEELVKQGKLLPKKVGEITDKKIIKDTAIKFYNAAAEKKNEIAKTIGDKGVSHLTTHKLATTTITSTIGTLIAFNLVTPVVKNVLARAGMNKKQCCSNDNPLAEKNSFANKFNDFINNPSKDFARLSLEPVSK